MIRKTPNVARGDGRLGKKTYVNSSKIKFEFYQLLPQTRLFWNQRIILLLEHNKMYTGIQMCSDYWTTLKSMTRLADASAHQQSTFRSV